MSWIGETIDEVRDKTGESRELRIAFALFAVLLVGIIGMTIAVLFLDTDASDQPTEAEQAELLLAANTTDDPASNWAKGALGLGFVVVLLMIAGSAYAIVRLWRQGGPDYDDLPDDEKRRRREAAALLRHIDDP